MDKMNEAEVLASLAYVEEHTAIYENDMKCAAIERATVRRESVMLILDQGISLARVCRANGVTRKTMNDWLAAEELTRAENQVQIQPDK
jgi:hypothetical protein